MAHEIFNDRFFGFRIPAWHGLGTVFEDAQMTAVRAIEEGGLDYAVQKHPIVIDTEWGPLDTGKLALVREPLADDPTPRIFATGLDKNYGLLQNRQIAEMVEDISKTWPVETVGALGYGERIFLTLRVGGTEVGGSELQEFLMLHEAKDGSGAINIKYTTVRVVCSNTLQMALDNGLDAVKLSHTGDVAERMKFELDLMSQLRRATDSVRETLVSLAELRITEEQASGIFKAALPEPAKPRPFRFANITPDTVDGKLYIRERERAEAAHKEWESTRNRRNEFREAYGELYAKLNDEFPQAAGTAWHAINAVTELADHRAGAVVDEVSERFAVSEQRRYESVLFGDRAREKAGAVAEALRLLSSGGMAGESRSKVAVPARRSKVAV